MVLWTPTHSLYVPSLCYLASDSVHTYHSGSASTTLDYVLGNLAILSSCVTLDEDQLNTSDHLPIVKPLI